MIRGNDGEMTVNVNREDLIRVLQLNLKKHTQDYKETLELYYKQLLVDLKELTAQAKAKTKKRIQFNPAQPKSYEKTYTDTIEMLMMSVDETINLDMDNFRKFVKDEWDWKNEFSTVSNFYKNSPIGG
jgi:hypothetical protein